MNKDLVTTSTNGENTQTYEGYHDFKVIEVNVSSPTESLYAVCTPVKIKE
ncbi:hypothetical protein [Niallia sp. Krafla_26]